MISEKRRFKDKKIDVTEENTQGVISVESIEEPERKEANKKGFSIPAVDVKKTMEKGTEFANVGFQFVKKNAESVKDGLAKTAESIQQGIKGNKKHTEQADTEANADEKSEKKKTLDDELKQAITGYNEVYTSLNDSGTKLFNQRERSIDLLENIENLINSIANRPKQFDVEIAEINVEKSKFKDVYDFAKEELYEARKSAVSAGAGTAAGIAVASLAPSAAMWIATTFGTASTGTAISTLSGAAATKAALAWLGGGALTAGGGGIAAGNALLALAGPIGWGVAGATLLTSIVLFANKKRKINKEKKDEIESILRNTEALKETEIKIHTLLKQTRELRENLSNQYTKTTYLFGQDFAKMNEEQQMSLGAIVNNAKALSATLNTCVQSEE